MNPIRRTISLSEETRGGGFYVSYPAPSNFSEKHLQFAKSKL